MHCDKWKWRPTACTVALVGLFVFIGGMPVPLNVPLFILALVACPLLALLLIGWACVFLWQWRLRQAASALLAVAVPVLLLVPMAFVQPYLQLGLTVTLGIGYLGPTPDEHQPVKIYDWSTGIVGTGNTFLIQDTTDAIASPAADRTPPAWRNTDFFGECAGRSKHLIAHYYVCMD